MDLDIDYPPEEFSEREVWDRTIPGIIYDLKRRSKHLVTRIEECERTLAQISETLIKLESRN